MKIVLTELLPMIVRLHALSQALLTVCYVHTLTLSLDVKKTILLFVYTKTLSVIPILTVMTVRMNVWMIALKN